MDDRVEEKLKLQGKTFSFSRHFRLIMTPQIIATTNRKISYNTKLLGKLLISQLVVGPLSSLVLAMNIFRGLRDSSSRGIH